MHLPLLRQAFKVGHEKHEESLAAFRAENAFWLEDYALFMALRGQQEGKPFHQWPEPLLLRQPVAMAQARQALAEEIHFWEWVQYIFFKQWNALCDYAARKGVGMIGDMPLYPSLDSADVWANPDVFQLDARRQPTAVAGVPPDAFTDDGQLWGNPLYDWPSLKADGYKWWIERLRLASRMYGQVRIDHFRGLAEYYAIPAQAKNARTGIWRPGPGMDLLERIREELPDCHLIAEDLGIASEGLQRLLRDSGLPGMKVLQFAFDPDGDSDYLPHHFVQNCVGYTGTHDNDTVVGWARTAKPEELRFVRDYLNLNLRDGYHWGMIRALYATPADLVIVPIQDFLGLDSKARMNQPGASYGQWGWRVNGNRLTLRLADRIRELAELYRRVPSPSPKHSEPARPATRI